MPYHAGELDVQRRAGESATAVANGRVIATAIIPGARGFIGQQTAAVVASVDGDGLPWASLLLGSRGFLAAGDRHIDIDRDAAFIDAADPLWRHLDRDRRLGALFIELVSRRRYRVNGSIDDPAARRLRFAVAEAYPNCPQYIQRRHARPAAAAAGGDDLRGSGRLGDAQVARIRAADTAFVASASPGGQLDASHRGGPAGFIEVVDGTRLRIPDYPGNSMFNTLGNVALHPFAGLAIPDFPANRMVQVAGPARILFAQPDPSGRTAGSGRWWELDIAAWRDAPLPASLAWEFLDASPFNPRPAEVPHAG